MPSHQECEKVSPQALWKREYSVILNEIKTRNAATSFRGIGEMKQQTERSI